MMCLGVCFLGSNFFGSLWASWTYWKSISFARLRKFSFILFSNKFSVSCSSSSLLVPLYSDVGTFQVVLEFPKPLLIFLISCFFILFWLNVYFFLLLQIIDLSPGFHPFTVGSLYIFLYFTLHSLHFFLCFVTILNHFCEHPDYQCFELPSGRLAISSLLSCIFLELWSVLSFGPYFFIVVHLLCCKGQSLRYCQGGATQVTELWCCLWGRGQRGNNPTRWALTPLSVISPATHKQIGLFWCWFPGGWICVCSRTLWVSPTNSPVRLGVSPTEATPTDFYSQRFWGFLFPCWKPGLCSLSHSPVVPPGSSTHNVGPPGPQLLPHPPGPPAATLPHVLSAPPTSLGKCFYFNSLVFGLPYSLSFWLFSFSF